MVEVTEIMYFPILIFIVNSKAHDVYMHDLMYCAAATCWHKNIHVATLAHEADTADPL